jgi:hypothetical protein
VMVGGGRADGLECLARVAGRDVRLPDRLLSSRATPFVRGCSQVQKLLPPLAISPACFNHCVASAGMFTPLGSFAEVGQQQLLGIVVLPRLL